MLLSLVLYVLESNTKLNRKLGKPKYVIKTQTFLHLGSLRFNWKDISKTLLASSLVMKWRVHELGVQDFVSYSNISDQELDEIIRKFKNSLDCC